MASNYLSSRQEGTSPNTASMSPENFSTWACINWLFPLGPLCARVRDIVALVLYAQSLHTTNYIPHTPMYTRSSHPPIPAVHMYTGIGARRAFGSYLEFGILLRCCGKDRPGKAGKSKAVSTVQVTARSPWKILGWSIPGFHLCAQRQFAAMALSQG